MLHVNGYDVSKFEKSLQSGFLCPQFASGQAPVGSLTFALSLYPVLNYGDDNLILDAHTFNRIMASPKMTPKQLRHVYRAYKTRNATIPPFGTFIMSFPLSDSDRINLSEFLF